MHSILSFYIFLTPLVLCTILVPFVSRLSVRIGGIDAPDERKIHTQAVPRLGGIAIFAALLFTVIFFCDINQQLKGLLSGAIVIFLTGLADDLTGLTPSQKFIGEFLAAGLPVLMGGIVVRHLGTPFGLDTIELGMLAVPFTIIGIVGLINAINLLDGLDGLAGGVCIIACVSFAVISYSSGNSVLFPVTLALLGALLGFMRYNNFPATIFMGDGGSLLLGYCMGTFSVMLAGGGVFPVSPYVPLMILGVPILDTLVVIANRKRKGKRLFLPDKSHIHHRLLDMGIGHKFTVLIVFGITYLLNMIAILGCNLNKGAASNLSDTTLLLMLAITASAVYGILNRLTAPGGRFKKELSNNQSLLSTISYRFLVRMTGYIISAIKLLLMTILLLPALLTREDIASFSIVPLVMLILSIVVYLSRHKLKDLPLQLILYCFAALLVFALENYGRNKLVLEVPLLNVSHFLFFLLLISEGIKIFVRKRASHLVFSPFEYLIMFIVMCAPLLPHALTGQYHLMTVTAKSVILFVGFKLVIMRQSGFYNKILLAIALSSLIMAGRYLAGV